MFGSGPETAFYPEKIEQVDKKTENLNNNSEQKDILKNEVSILKDGLETRRKDKIESNDLKIEKSVSLTIGDKVYSSIDNNNPDLILNKDLSVQLEKYIIRKYRTAYNLGQKFSSPSSGLNGSTEKLSNSPEENLKLQNIINNFYRKNKEIVNEKLGIDNINNLKPAQATKLVSLITMDKLRYNHVQMMVPSKEKIYFDKISENEKIEYKKSLFISNIVKEIGMVLSEDPNYTKYFIDENNNLNVTILKEKGKIFYDYFYKTESAKYNWFKGIEDLSTSEVKDRSRNIIYELIIQEFPDINNINDIKQRIENGALGWDGADEILLNTIHAANSDFYNKNAEVDRISVSELLKGGKGVCRNYAIANEKLYESLKGLQKGDVNNLTNSALVYYVGNESGDKFNINLADSESGTNDHAWNILIVVGKDGKEHISQVDSTHADTGGVEGGVGGKKVFNQVDFLDKTYERIFNTLSDNLEKGDLMDIDLKILEFIDQLESQDKDGNMRLTINLKAKLVLFYELKGEDEKVLSVKKSMAADRGKKIKDIEGINFNKWINLKPKK